uniref:Uncharacterized protein n=1 Tax=Equus asinus TaxID=9793 RepID=A0A9L0JWN2_EQUAS
RLVIISSNRGRWFLAWPWVFSSYTRTAESSAEYLRAPSADLKVLSQGRALSYSAPEGLASLTSSDAQLFPQLKETSRNVSLPCSVTWRLSKHIEQTTEILLHLSPDEAANLKEGINFLRNKKTGKDYILYKNKSRLRACKNMCKHQGGLFIKDIEDFDGRAF